MNLAAILVLSAITIAAIVLAPELGPDVRRWRRPLTRRLPALREHPVYGRNLDHPADTHAVRHDGVITASGGSVTVKPLTGMIEPLSFPPAGRHAATLPRRFKERQPGPAWTAANPAARP